MVRKASRKTLKSKADRLFSLIIRERDKACRRCGTTESLQCAHIVSRRYHAVRWSLDNAIALCAGCHIYFTHRPIEWERAIEQWFGLIHYNRVKMVAMSYDKPDYEYVVQELTKFWQDLSNGLTLPQPGSQNSSEKATLSNG
jgi:hypothetical protein